VCVCVCVCGDENVHTATTMVNLKHDLNCSPCESRIYFKM